MTDLADKSCLVHDFGLFLPIALKLAEQFGKVYYYATWEGVQPTLEHGIVGDGFDSIDRIYEPEEYIGKVDCWCFPDIGDGEFQRYLRSQGERVWGHNSGDILEVSRGKFLETLEHLGMDVPHYEVIKGMTNLRLYLRDKEDVWIKMSRWRGSFETFHFLNWKMHESGLDQHAYRLGPAKELVTFYVFDCIETDIEDGVDAYCIDGEWPSLVLHGLERKDRSYLCAVQELSKIPESVRMVNEKFGPVLASYGYRGFFTSEVRIKDDKSYFLDATCRAASPASQAMCELFGNFGDIIWQGANGICVDPEPTARFAVQALVSMERDKDEWIALDVPKEIRPWFKCGFSCEIDGLLCIPPHPLGNMIGWLVATDDTIEGAIGKLKEYDEALPAGADADIQSLSHLLQEAQDAKDEGIVLARNIPDPAEVLDNR